MSISRFHYLSLSRLFPSKRKPNRTYLLFFCSLVLCVRVFLKETCVEKKTRKKKTWNSLYVSFCLCVYGSRFLCRLFFFFFFCELLLCSKLCFLFFFYAATITAAAAVFLYLFIKRLCMCVSAFIICCVFACVRAGHSFYFVVLCFLFSFIKNSLIYSQLKRKKPTVILSFFLCACVLIPTRLLCVCVVFFSVDYRWVSGCLYFIYLCVCMCVLCDYHRHRKKMTSKEKFCFVVMHGKTTELDSFFFFLTA